MGCRSVRGLTRRFSHTNWWLSCSPSSFWSNKLTHSVTLMSLSQSRVSLCVQILTPAHISALTSIRTDWRLGRSLSSSRSRSNDSQKRSKSKRKRRFKVLSHSPSHTLTSIIHHFATRSPQHNPWSTHTTQASLIRCGSKWCVRRRR